VGEKIVEVRSAVGTKRWFAINECSDFNNIISLPVSYYGM